MSSTSRRQERSLFQKIKDFVTFPFRALTMFENDRWGFSSLASERFHNVAREVQGYCLDVGCGRHNRLITQFLGGHGKGIDVYQYDGLDEEHIVKDMANFPFEAGSFDTVTFIASINHVPRSSRDIELAEAYRCLKPGGNIVITMGNPLAEILVHKVVWLYDKILGTSLDVDTERGMSEEEDYYLLDSEIKERLTRAGFQNMRKRYFATQWCLNHLLVASKPPDNT